MVIFMPKRTQTRRKTGGQLQLSFKSVGASTSRVSPPEPKMPKPKKTRKKSRNARADRSVVSPRKKKKHTYATAESMSKAQREISVSEFFAKNRHLLGFDNKRKALLTTVKEAVDNSLDACEEAGILPEIHVKIAQSDTERFCVTVRDNGPGIVEEALEKIFIPFFTTKKDGSGIGLSLSREIMRQHGGSISAVSYPNERTVFTLRF